jgi:hypothetical protein
MPNPLHPSDWHPAEVARALLLYETDVSAKHRAELLFPDEHPGYIAEWADRLAAGLSQALAQMDQATTERYVGFALAHGGKRARAWWTDEEAG